MPRAQFVGRAQELRSLEERLRSVASGRGDDGKAVLLRGRRRIGKSRLVTEFIERSGLPSFYYQAARHSPVRDQLRGLVDALAASTLPGASIARGVQPESLTAALRLVVAALPSDSKAIMVLDEIPWLLEGIPGGASELQRVWDHELAGKPVLMILLGSDLSMMKELSAHDQPFYGRGREMVLRGLSPADVAGITGLAGMEAFDAYLITGGQPIITEDWMPGETPSAFVARSFENPISALAIEGARVLDVEFPRDTHPRAVLTAIGGRGERTRSGIEQALDGRITAPTLSRALETLSAAEVVTADEPYSTRRAPKDRRWRIADPALRFWLALVEPALNDIDRGRPDLAVARFERSHAAWRGRAIEPVVRDALWRLLPDDGFPTAERIGGWWPRTNTPEIDLVAGTGMPATELAFIGSIKWRSGPMTAADVDALAAAAPAVPGYRAGVPLVTVCPGGADDARLARAWTADDLLAAM